MINKIKRDYTYDDTALNKQGQYLSISQVNIIK